MSDLLSDGLIIQMNHKNVHVVQEVSNHVSNHVLFIHKKMIYIKETISRMLWNVRLTKFSILSEPDVAYIGKFLRIYAMENNDGKAIE